MRGAGFQVGGSWTKQVIKGRGFRVRGVRFRIIDVGFRLQGVQAHGLEKQGV